MIVPPSERTKSRKPSRCGGARAGAGAPRGKRPGSLEAPIAFRPTATEIAFLRSRGESTTEALRECIAVARIFLGYQRPRCACGAFVKYRRACARCRRPWPQKLEG